MALYFGVYSQLSPATPSSLMERALSLAYRPLLTYLYNTPDLKMHLYFSPTTLEWFEHSYPEIGMLLSDLIKRQQVELLGGSYHQAILQLLQIKDRSNELERTTTFIRRRFGQRPRSIWLYNQIWNSSYISPLHMANVERVVISTYDQLQQQQGQQDPFIMHDMGKMVEIVPTFYPVEHLIKEYATKEKTFDQVTKELETLTFGSSQSAFVMVNIDHLLQGCCEDNEEMNQDVISSLIHSLFDKNQHHSSLLQESEMDATQQKGFLRSSWYGLDSSIEEIKSFNELLLQSEELHHLHGRSLYLHELTRIYKKNKDVRKRVHSLLAKATSGAPFTYDASGGMYRSCYRKHIYASLIEAQRVLSSSESISFPLSYDLDLDGRKEILWQGKNIGSVLSATGGALEELSYLPTSWNYGDTFSGLSHNGDVKKGTFQRSFNDVLLPSQHTLDPYNKYDTKQVYNCGEHIYNVQCDAVNRHEVVVSLDVEKLPFSLGSFHIEKKYSFKANTIVVEFSLTNTGKHKKKGYFGSELNLSFKETEKSTYSLYTVEKSRNKMLNNEQSLYTQLKNMRVIDVANKTLLSVASDARFTLYKNDHITELETIGGVEQLYQHTLLLPIWEFDLAGGATKKWTVGLRIERSSKVAYAKKELS
ncbi:MAG: alpha-amylase/4-alpha-glucanotransferase domain-containing protein [Sphaerochaetaceae bacterium]